MTTQIAVEQACNECYISVLTGTFDNSQDVRFICEAHTGKNCSSCDRYGAGYGDGHGGYCDLCDRDFAGYFMYHTYESLPLEWHNQNRPPVYDEL